MHGLKQQPLDHTYILVHMNFIYLTSWTLKQANVFVAHSVAIGKKDYWSTLTYHSHAHKI
jgi:hypothetical protein